MTEPTPEPVKPYEHGFVIASGQRLRAIRYNSVPPKTFYYPLYTQGIIIAGETIAATFEPGDWFAKQQAEEASDGNEGEV